MFTVAMNKNHILLCGKHFCQLSFLCFISLHLLSMLWNMIWSTLWIKWKTKSWTNQICKHLGNIALGKRVYSIANCSSLQWIKIRCWLVVNILLQKCVIFVKLASVLHYIAFMMHWNNNMIWSTLWIKWKPNSYFTTFVWCHQNRQTLRLII